MQGAGEYGSASGVTFIKGTTIILDPASALYTAIGAGNLRAYVQGADDAGHQGWATRRAERCRRGGRIGSMTSGTRLMAALAIVVLAGCGGTGSLPPPEPPPFSCTPDPQIAPLCGQTTTAPVTTWPPTEASTAPPATAPPSVSPTASNPPPTQVHDPGRVTGTLAGKHCAVLGTPPHQRPDPGCTPGAYDPHITAAILCAPRYTTRTYRPPVRETTRFKYDQAYPAYGVPPGTRSELDHLISLELAGSNDAANLWPETGRVPNPKDAVENRMHDWVCAASGTQAQQRLEQAQRAIAADWTTGLAVLGVPGG